MIETRYEHVVLDDEKVPMLAGTTMKVVELIVEQQAYGWSPEELHFQHPYLEIPHHNLARKYAEKMNNYKTTRS